MYIERTLLRRVIPRIELYKMKTQAKYVLYVMRDGYLSR